MTAFSPPPFGSSFNLTVKSCVLIAVTSYSLPSSPAICAKLDEFEDASADEKAIISPTLNAVPASTLKTAVSTTENVSDAFDDLFNS